MLLDYKVYISDHEHHLHGDLAPVSRQNSSAVTAESANSPYNDDGTCKRD